MVSFLVDEKSEDPDNVVEAAVGLIVYGAITQEKLQGVDDNKEEFKRQLTADKDGVPAAICDLLFGKYWAGKSDRGRLSSGGELDDRQGKRQCVMQDAKTSKRSSFACSSRACSTRTLSSCLTA